MTSLGNTFLFKSNSEGELQYVHLTDTKGRTFLLDHTGTSGQSSTHGLAYDLASSYANTLARENVLTPRDSLDDSASCQVADCVRATNRLFLTCGASTALKLVLAVPPVTRPLAVWNTPFSAAYCGTWQYMERHCAQQCSQSGTDPDNIPSSDPDTLEPVSTETGSILTASSWADPHLVTFDGLAYDFQAVGEFVLARSSDGEFGVQARQEPYQYSRAASVNTGVGIRMGETEASVYLLADGIALYIGDSLQDLNVFQPVTTECPYGWHV